MTADLLMPLRRLHGFIYEKRREKEDVKKLCNRIKNTDKGVALFVLSPTHGNLGDHAIALSTMELLSEIGLSFIEVTIVQLNRLQHFNKLDVMNGRKIIVNGGGNLGTLWFGVEKMFRNIIKKNPQSAIYCFPNTIFYEDTEWGRREADRSKQIYNNHRELYLYAREKKSFDTMKSMYCRVELIPDMVLFMNESETQRKRDGCLLCLRNDIEKTRTEEQEGQIVSAAHRLFGERVKRTDMCLEHGVTVENRKHELSKKFNEFKGAQLVITDRLHGMIFAAITGTPCIVINSKSPKLKGCYEWIEHLQYIQFADNAEQIDALYNEIPKQVHKYDNITFSAYRKQLKRDLIDPKA